MYMNWLKNYSKFLTKLRMTWLFIMGKLYSFESSRASKYGTWKWNTRRVQSCSLDLKLILPQTVKLRNQLKLLLASLNQTYGTNINLTLREKPLNNASSQYSGMRHQAVRKLRINIMEESAAIIYVEGAVSSTLLSTSWRLLPRNKFLVSATTRNLILT